MLLQNLVMSCSNWYVYALVDLRIGRGRVFVLCHDHFRIWGVAVGSVAIVPSLDSFVYELTI